MSETLTPPDLLRCQAEKPNGTNFMTMGGNIGGRVRCKALPVIIIQERVPGPDGHIGSMSLCASCLVVLQEQEGMSNFKLVELPKE